MLISETKYIVKDNEVNYELLFHVHWLLTATLRTVKCNHRIKNVGGY